MLCLGRALLLPNGKTIHINRNHDKIAQSASYKIQEKEKTKTNRQPKSMGEYKNWEQGTIN